MHFIQVKIDVFAVAVVETVEHEQFLYFPVKIRSVAEQVFRRLLGCRVVVHFLWRHVKERVKLCYAIRCEGIVHAGIHESLIQFR